MALSQSTIFLQQQCEATASAMGLSLPQIVRLLAMLLPSCGVLSQVTVVLVAGSFHRV